jgi:hypothetical protein
VQPNPDRSAEGEAPAQSAEPTQPTRPTALDRIDAALEQLADRPLAEQADGYERLHADLQAALAEIDGA